VVVVARWRHGYDPREVLAADPELATLIHRIADGRYTPHERDVLTPLVRNLVDQDPFMVLADFRAYLGAQERVSAAWRDVDSWTRASIHNVAGMGRFSSDRSIRDYVREVWQVPQVKV
jgi:starch phosphorylase